jgi:1,4-dihydroxy-2-naphthoate octaprenyltransferase
MGLVLRMIRGRFLIVSFVSAALGAAAAHRARSPFPWPDLVLVFLGAAFVHAGCNLWNDYADDRNGTDRINKAATSFNGGSRVIQNGEASARTVKHAAMACFLLAAGTALVLVPKRGWVIPALVLVGILTGVCYSSSPLWFSGRGLGELAVAVCFGPMLVQGAVVALSGRFSPAACYASLPLGLLVAAILTINGMPDGDADRGAGKRTLPVRLGIPATVHLYCAFVGMAFILTLTGLIGGILPAWTGIVFCAAPLAGWICWRVCRLKSACGTAYGFASPVTILLHFTFGLLMILGFSL